MEHIQLRNGHFLSPLGLAPLRFYYRYADMGLRSHRFGLKFFLLKGEIYNDHVHIFIQETVFDSNQEVFRNPDQSIRDVCLT